MGSATDFSLPNCYIWRSWRSLCSSALCYVPTRSPILLSLPCSFEYAKTWRSFYFCTLRYEKCSSKRVFKLDIWLALKLKQCPQNTTFLMSENSKGSAASERGRVVPVDFIWITRFMMPRNSSIGAVWRLRVDMSLWNMISIQPLGTFFELNHK